MKTNLSSQITLTRIPLRYYRPENAFEHSVLTRLEKIPTNIYESAEEGSFAIAKEIATQINEDSEQLSDCVRKLLDVMEYDVAYTSNRLMEKLELKSREGFRRNYLKHALELNLVCMTIPDKPNSKNQRYIKK
jgi:hypothetical protein